MCTCGGMFCNECNTSFELRCENNEAKKKLLREKNKEKIAKFTKEGKLISKQINKLENKKSILYKRLQSLGVDKVYDSF